jgi:hypothetical protein
MRRLRLLPLACLAAVAAACAGSSRHVVHGPLFAGSGGICASGTSVRFQGRSDVAASPPPTTCDGGIPLRGFDVGRLANGIRWHGVTTGAAYVEGVYRNGALTVTAQGAPRAENAGLRLGVLPRDAGRVFAVTRTRLEAVMPHDGIYEVGPATTKRGQPIVFLRVMFVTPRLRALLRTMPRGAVRVLPNLSRIGSA